MKDEYKFAKYTFSKTSKVLSEENTCFQEFQGWPINLMVVNNTEERGIALIKAYYASLLKNEQKQLLFRLVEKYG